MADRDVAGASGMVILPGGIVTVDTLDVVESLLSGYPGAAARLFERFGDVRSLDSPVVHALLLVSVQSYY